MGLLSTVRNFVTTKLRRRYIQSDTLNRKKHVTLELPMENSRRPDTSSIGGPDFHFGDGRTCSESSDDALAFVISSDSENPCKDIEEVGDDGESMCSSSDLELLEALWPEMASTEGLSDSQSSMIVSPCNFNVAYPTPVHWTRRCQIMKDMPLQVHCPHPSQTFSRCFAILLRDIRNGYCTRRNFDTLLKLIKMRGPAQLSSLQTLVGSAIMHLLISRMTDETFKASGSYEEAFEALVQLLDNANILEWCVQPDFLEIVDWMLRMGTMEGKKNALTFLLKVSSNDREKFESTVVSHSQSIMGAIVAVILKRSLLHLLNPALITIFSLCLSPNIHDVAAKAGLIEALIEILPLRNPEREEFIDMIAENCLSILKLLSTTSDGLQSLREHCSLLALMIDVMLEFSESATGNAVEVFQNMCTPTLAPNLVIVAREEGSVS